MIKTRLQVASKVEFQDYRVGNFRLPDGGMTNCGLQIYASEGFHGFWKGFSACTIKATIPNGLMFVAYEFAQKQYFQMSH